MLSTTRAVSATLRIDGVLHDLADVAILPQPEPFPGGLRWTLVLSGPSAARLVARAQALPSGAAAARLLDELRLHLPRSGGGVPRFSLNTIDEVDVGPSHVRLGGTCSLLVPGAFGGPALRA